MTTTTMAKKDWYDVLQVSPQASEVVIRASHKALAKQYSEQMYGARQATSEQRLKEINCARDVLVSQTQRTAYDAEWARQRGVLRNDTARVIALRHRVANLEQETTNLQSDLAVERRQRQQAERQVRQAQQQRPYKPQDAGDYGFGDTVLRLIRKQSELERELNEAVAERNTLAEELQRERRASIEVLDGMRAWRAGTIALGILLALGSLALGSWAVALIAFSVICATACNAA